MELIVGRFISVPFEEICAWKSISDHSGIVCPELWLLWGLCVIVKPTIIAWSNRDRVQVVSQKDMICSTRWIVESPHLEPGVAKSVQATHSYGKPRSWKVNSSEDGERERDRQADASLIMQPLIKSNAHTSYLVTVQLSLRLCSKLHIVIKSSPWIVSQSTVSDYTLRCEGMTEGEGSLARRPCNYTGRHVHGCCWATMTFHKWRVRNRKGGFWSVVVRQLHHLNLVPWPRRCSPSSSRIGRKRPPEYIYTSPQSRVWGGQESTVVISAHLYLLEPSIGGTRHPERAPDRYLE